MMITDGDIVSLADQLGIAYINEGNVINFARALLLAAGVQPCAHRLVDARNGVVESGYMCVDCGAVFAAADHVAAPSVADAACLDCQENCRTCGIYKKSGSNRAMSFEEFCDLHIDAQDTIDRAWLQNFMRLWDVFRQGDPSSVADAAGANDVQLFQRLLHARSEIGRTIADPMWADHAEVSKAALKRWHSTIDTVIAKESGHD